MCAGLFVLAGIAAGDAIWDAAIGEHYSGRDHAAAADMLARVDADAGKLLRRLVGLKPAAHCGRSLLGARDGTAAQAAAKKLVAKANDRYV